MANLYVAIPRSLCLLRRASLGTSWRERTSITREGEEITRDCCQVYDVRRDVQQGYQDQDHGDPSHRHGATKDVDGWIRCRVVDGGVLRVRCQSGRWFAGFTACCSGFADLLDRRYGMQS